MFRVKKHFCTSCTELKLRYILIRPVHTERKRTRKRKRSKNYRKRSKKIFQTTKKNFAFAFVFAWYERTLSHQAKVKAKAKNIKEPAKEINEKFSNRKEKFRFCFRFRFSFCSVWMGPYKNGHWRQPNRFHVFMSLDSPPPPFTCRLDSLVLTLIKYRLSKLIKGFVCFISDYCWHVAGSWNNVTFSRFCMAGRLDLFWEQNPISEEWG